MRVFGNRVNLAKTRRNKGNNSINHANGNSIYNNKAPKNVLPRLPGKRENKILSSLVFRVSEPFFMISSTTKSISTGLKWEIFLSIIKIGDKQ
ncbi:MAG: hypothetical protein HXS53_03005 [Theionarchaea archaeon]|nr:hypothetical protein [Theionarchaea archaeon]